MIRFSRRADIQINTLRPANHKRVQQVLKSLEKSPQDFDPALDIRKLDSPDNIYLVKVGPSLRVFFTNALGDIEVLDIIPQERIDEFHAAFATAGDK